MKNGQLLTWGAGVIACVLFWVVFYGFIHTNPNVAGHLISGGGGIAMGLLAKGAMKRYLEVRRSGQDGPSES
jgi:hypothetical protein